MNARALSAMVLSMLLSFQAGAFAETERETETETEAESAELQTPRVDVRTLPFVMESHDFREPSLAGGAFEPPSGTMFTAFGIGMFAASGADLASTEVTLSVPGGYESNRFQRNRNVRILTHVAVPAFMYWATDKLRDRGKTKTALFARIGFNIAYSYAVMHNLRVASSTP
jgi:hypothetical protein